MHSTTTKVCRVLQKGGLYWRIPQRINPGVFEDTLRRRPQGTFSSHHCDIKFIDRKTPIYPVVYNSVLTIPWPPIPSSSTVPWSAGNPTTAYSMKTIKVMPAIWVGPGPYIAGRSSSPATCVSPTCFTARTRARSVHGYISSKSVG